MKVKEVNKCLRSRVTPYLKMQSQFHIVSPCDDKTPRVISASSASHFVFFIYSNTSSFTKWVNSFNQWIRNWENNSWISEEPYNHKLVIMTAWVQLKSSPPFGFHTNRSNGSPPSRTGVCRAGSRQLSRSLCERFCVSLGKSRGSMPQAKSSSVPLPLTWLP